MKKLFCFLTGFILLSVQSISQRKYSLEIGTDKHDGAITAIQTHDSGYAILGTTQFISTLYVVKLNKKGAIEWAKKFLMVRKMKTH